MILPITSIYGSLLALIILFLSFKVGAMRGKLEISLGDGGNPQMLESIRRHSNAIEYAPMAVILIALLEVNEANTLLLHVLGATLVVSRVLHPMGLKAENMNELFRGLGMGGTVLVMLVCAAYLIWLGLLNLVA